jgi:cytidylate kinase
MKINDKIIKHCLKNVMFINGTAYAGKSTMVAMLAEKYDLIHCGENYHGIISNSIATPAEYPNLCYFETMKDWQEFINRTPEEYSSWIDGATNEVMEFEIAYLMSISHSKKVIVDTNITTDVLRKIADYNQVAIMLSPQSMSTDYFFVRDDEDKKFIKEQIMKAENPEKTMANYRECIARINSKEYYDKFADSGFFTIVRKDVATNTKLETLNILAKHFGLE